MDQQADFVAAAPGEELKTQVNQSIRLHSERNLKLEDIHQLEGGRNQVRLLLIYEKR
ncbi:MAG: hypothetical protein ABEJ03_00720 [Candidatus Nanohaloarchaea archaeon]